MTRPGAIRGEAMRVCVTDAEAQLTELVRRVEAGDAVILTRHGQPVVRPFSVPPTPDRKARGTIIAAVRASAPAERTPGPGAARSQDVLYADDGLPG